MEKAAAFIRQKGFYFVLLGCLAVVGVTAFVTLAQPPAEEEEVLQAGQSGDQTLEQVQNATPTPAPVVVPTPPASMIGGGAATPSPAPTPESAPAPEPEEEDAASPKGENLLFAPVEGEILTAFADATLLYSKTLKQWTSHKGLDIAAPRGTAVRAVADGVVESVENDIMMGYTISIRHEGFRTVYANLDALPSLKAGDAVKAGTEIGAVGSSAIAESADEPHLHFELYIGEKAVDPLPHIRGVASIPIK